MIIGCVKELKVHEYRVGTIPDHVHNLVVQGHQVFVESGCGAACGFSDDDYRDAGAKVFATADEVWESCDIMVKVKEPLAEEFKYFREGLMICTYFHLASVPELAQALVDKGVIGIAYETVLDEKGQLPLLRPMSQIAGCLSIQQAVKYLELQLGGRGILLSGVPGVHAGKVVVIGGGEVGRNAAKVANGFGSNVVVIDNNIDILNRIDDQYNGEIATVYSTEKAIHRELRDADVVIGSVLIPGANAPKLIKKAYLKDMKKGSIIVDVAIDQGGCAETSRPTTHEDPVYMVDGILHYCVTNMPGVVANTSTVALTNATSRYLNLIANRGLKQACQAVPLLKTGLNTMNGQVTHPAVAQALGYTYVDPSNFLE